MIRTFLRSAVPLAMAFGLPATVLGQHAHDHGDSTVHTSTAAHSSEMAGMKMDGGANWKMEAMAKHMAYSSARPLMPGDSARAAQVINELRQAIAKYQDVNVAEADGYKMFAPQIKNQPQYHFTKGWNAIRNQWGFDPARPTSLLYTKDAQGKFHLIGAMYTASRRTSEEELDKRIPLSVARWHRHVNWCVPARYAKERWYETKDGRPIFGPLGVATREECKAADGRFIPQAFGWMVHANVFAGDDLKSIWHDDHMEHDQHAMMGDPKRPD
ncbi:MAG TPA: hypothetical protein VJ825_13290 [Gemmatimonadaceae bacterium]|nr:hypothetical protein [Gemmatimonadaceae bacterium]